MNKTETIEQRAQEMLQSYASKVELNKDYEFDMAMCWTQVHRYMEARSSYRRVLEDFLHRGKVALWFRCDQPNWLADTYVMADQPASYDRAYQELAAWRQIRGDRGLSFLYSYALIHVVGRRDSEAVQFVPGMLAFPKSKWTFAAGKAIQAIVERKQESFDAALGELLLAHRGMAKFGDLRWAAEGLLCLPAMSLSKMAMDRGMTVNVESEYLSKGYLEYLRIGLSA